MTHETKPPTLAEAIASLPIDQRVHYYSGAAKETARQTVDNVKKLERMIQDSLRYPSSWVEYRTEIALAITHSIIAANRPIAEQNIDWLELS